MKIDDGPLNRYLIKNLQPLTEADPSLLANYVAALLKNNKPRKELQKLCIDQLYDFLGDGTKSFVAKLFQSLEDGTIPSPAEEMDANKCIESVSAIASADVELRMSPPHLERLPSTALRSFSDEGEDESSDDEDDDRNHKHRRRVTPSRPFDRDREDEAARGLYRKRGRSVENGQFLRENDRQGNERRVSGHTLHAERDGQGKFERRLGRDHGSGRFNTEGGQRVVMRSGPQFREGPGRFDSPSGMIRVNMGRGRGLGGSWSPHDQRFALQAFPDGPDFPPSLLPPAPGLSFFPGRSIPTRTAPHTPWPGYGPLPGMGNGTIEHAHPLGGGMQGVRGPPAISAGMGISINMGMGRPRCLDFEERGYCLRGDLCPMEHGANRIVVEDVQSLSKFNLPVSLPGGRGMSIGPASGPSSGAILPPGLGFINRSNCGSREPSLPVMGEDPASLNGVPPGIACTEPDSYDPDQPLWNKDRPEASSSLRKLSSFPKEQHDQEWECKTIDKRENREGSESTETGRISRLGGNSHGGPQSTECGPSVWDRIGPVMCIGSRLDGSVRMGSTSVDVLHSGKQLKKDSTDEVLPRVRVAWQGRWTRDLEADEGSVPRGSTAPYVNSRGRGSGRGDVASGQRSGEGTSCGMRGVGGRSNNVFGTERAQRTLYVSFIPPNSNRSELLLAHFQKFGDVQDIRIPAHSDRAFVQFSQREDAESALTAPDAVMGNRFIRLSWANRDSVPDTTGNTSSGSRAVQSGTCISTGQFEDVVKVFQKGVTNGCGTVQAEVMPIEGVGRSALANGSASPALSGGVVKKQEELERMREEIRKKQESLAQKRDDFRRKLDQLAKQGSVHGETSDTEHPSKRQKLDDPEETGRKVVASQPSLSLSAASAPVEPSSPSTALMKTNSEDIPKVNAALVMIQALHTTQRGGRLPPTRITNCHIPYTTSSVAWGPARFKLDNRTTVFRVLPPFPTAAMDVGVLKEHFLAFGEVVTIEVEDPEGVKVDESLLSETASVRVSFATRRVAERAFLQGRWLQGQSLHFVWVSPPCPTSGGTTRTDLVGEKLPVTTSKCLTDLSSSTGQTGKNGCESNDQDSPRHDQDTQITTRDISEVEVAIAGTRDEKKISSTVQNLDWRRETGLQVHVFPKSGRISGSSDHPTENAVETVL